MGLAIAEIEMARADLRVDAEDRPRVTARNHVGCGLDAEGGGRAACQHIEAEAFDAQRLLDLDGDLRVWPLQDRCGNHNTVDIGGSAMCRVQRLPRGSDADLGRQPEL